MVALSAVAGVEWRDARCVKGRSCVASARKKDRRAMKITVNNHQLDVEEGDEVYVSEWWDELDDMNHSSIALSRGGKVIKESVHT